MAQVQVGTILSNNDRRDYGAQIQVAGIEYDNKVGISRAVYYTTRKNSIRFDRIFDDGRKRSVGWSVVKQPSEPTL
jgi:hypothetical protein